MLDQVEHPERVLNMHFLMPPEINPVGADVLRPDRRRDPGRTHGAVAAFA